MDLEHTLRVKPEKDYLSSAKCLFGGDLWQIVHAIFDN